MRKLTVDEYIQSLEDRDIEYVSGYINTNVKCLHRCKIDGHEWEATPDNIRRGKGCPKCKALSTGLRCKLPKDAYLQLLEGGDIEYVSGYVNTKVKCLHRCKIDGHEWEAAPDNIRRGKGCPKCAKYGFQLQLPGTLYFLISDEGYLKIGISNTPSARLRELMRATPFSFTTYGQHKAAGVTIAELEKSLHRRLKKYHAGLSGFDGASEWFRATSEVLELVNRVIATGSLKKPLPEVKHEKAA